MIGIVIIVAAGLMRIRPSRAVLGMTAFEGNKHQSQPLSRSALQEESSPDFIAAKSRSLRELACYPTGDLGLRRTNHTHFRGTEFCAADQIPFSLHNTSGTILQDFRLFYLDLSIASC